MGGAGAQAEIAEGMVKSLKKAIKANRIRLNLVAAHRPEVKLYFERLLKKTGLSETDGLVIFNENEGPILSNEFNSSCVTQIFSGQSLPRCPSTADWVYRLSLPRQ